MNLSSEELQNILNQEINDTDSRIYESGMNEEELKEYKKKKCDQERAKKKLEYLMDRKLYNVEKERLNELEEVEQIIEQYPVESSKTKEILEMYSTEQPQNVRNRVDKIPTSDFIFYTSKDLFHKIFTTEVLMNIVNYTNERINVEELISVELKYYHEYCDIFDDINKEIKNYRIPNSYIIENIKINTLIDLKSTLTNQNNLIKYLDILIKSPKPYIMEKCIEIFHLERLMIFAHNDNQCEYLKKYFEKIEQFHNEKIEVRKISPINEKELNWFFGALIYIGGRGYENIEIAFKNDETLKYHALTHRRFKEISRCLRFDSFNERNQDDPLAPVLYLLEVVQKAIKRLYNPSNKFTIDEHIIPFTGAFKYSVNIKDKPHSRGIRVDCLNDCATGYLYGFKLYSKSTSTSTEMSTDEKEEQINQNEQTQFIPNTAQQTQLSTQNETQFTQDFDTVEETQRESDFQESQQNTKKQGRPKKKETISKTKKPSKSTKYNYQYSMPTGQIAQTVIYLLNDFEKNQPNNDSNDIMIGMDNYYTTREVINYLTKKGFGFCGTMRVLRNYIPLKLKLLNLEEYESVQISKGDITMVNYKSKLKKNVFLISNMIDKYRRNKQQKKKPEIVLLYNSMKGATDRYDHLISNCDLRRKANRYQLAVLYDMLNLIVTDIYIIKKLNDEKLDHREFIIDLGLKLLDIDIPVNPPTLCCCTIPSNVNCKLTDQFFIMRVHFPNDTKHVGSTNCYLCNQCGKPIPTHTLNQVIFNYCQECSEDLQFPNTFTIRNGRKSKSK